MARTARRIAAIVFVAALALTTTIPEASAGGSWMYPVKDRYEPGETVTMVGYFGGGAYGPLADEPYFAFLRLTDPDGIAVGEQLPVGELEFSKVDYQWRVSITFELAPDLTPGVYLLDYCTKGCERRVGDLIGGYVTVGMDPSYPSSRPWPANEPEIENLDDDVGLWINGLETTAAAVRNGVWVPQATPEPHNDYPPSTPTPTIVADSAAAAATPEPSLAPDEPIPAQSVVERILLRNRPVTAEAAATGLASSQPSTSMMLGALLATGAATVVGRRVLRKRSQIEIPEAP